MRYRFVSLVVCILAVLFALSGVRRLMAAEGGVWNSARGAGRIVFGAGMFVVSAVAVVRGKRTDQDLANSAEPAAAPDRDGK